jgi:hypothetical protein
MTTLAQKFLVLSCLAGIVGCVGIKEETKTKSPRGRKPVGAATTCVDINWSEKQTMSVNDATELAVKCIEDANNKKADEFRLIEANESGIKYEKNEIVFTNSKTYKNNPKKVFSADFHREHVIRFISFSKISEVYYYCYPKSGVPNPAYYLTIAGEGVRAADKNEMTFRFLEVESAKKAASAWLTLCPNVTVGKDDEQKK